MPTMQKKSENYTEFVNKFKPKKTTDDCYTPPAFYDIVLKYVAKLINLRGKKILRPFKPGGNYQKEKYTENTVVIDNPPFSILSEIVRWYNERNIKYFLFAPHLTLFGTARTATAVVANVRVIYENRAHVSTSFITNIPDPAKQKIIITNYFREEYDKIRDRKQLQKTELGRNIISAAQIRPTKKDINIKQSECTFTRNSQGNKKIFGGGYKITTAKMQQIKRNQQTK